MTQNAEFGILGRRLQTGPFCPPWQGRSPDFRRSWSYLFLPSDWPRRLRLLSGSREPPPFLKSKSPRLEASDWLILSWFWIQVMLYPGCIVVVHGQWCVIQRSQQVLPHIPNLGGVFLHTHEDKVNMVAVQFHQFAFGHLIGLIVLGNADYRLFQQLKNAARSVLWVVQPGPFGFLDGYKIAHPYPYTHTACIVMAETSGTVHILAEACSLNSLAAHPAGGILTTAIRVKMALRKPRYTYSAFSLILRTTALSYWYP